MKYDRKTADYWHKKLSFICRAAPREVLIKAVISRIDNKKKNLSIFDCVGYMYAIENKMNFVTGDKVFESLESVDFITK
ncbi:hypothetical protein HYU06_02465 [Candidatus Woesearchaeota archaeon]|nr:hypothetical protein [Candidatus Woesearchaeota archaeon]